MNPVTNLNRGSLTSAIKSYVHFEDQIDAIWNFKPIICDDESDASGASDESNSNNPGLPQYFLDWAREMIQFCIDTAVSKRLGHPDGVAMTYPLLEFVDNPSEFLFQT